ncbi:acetyl-CoA carboxylase biotin carboxyl carrier protein [Brytella acorum]|uniref:Biotin carboxyl carrier protein of acetyl-CoA carboxylase n=1 Tax=Brytella acorum TaxID=2959299 RepID=A0AA35Y3I1_9PROT|nr:acetyl-CoA carboxylase biotin carboxyl carrier protein subunit [Brytella acorum]MDF3624025.1 acetyl-CoA carboxylase biotin carboxyl carrier protein subunit [Brytella acorum]CAI9120872.1 acetyl-CoA carboxylase biotin carboxyl carrier protein subunit [Brytella acorum]
MSPMLVDADAIRALADILTETGLTEIEVAEGDSRIRVARGGTVTQVAATPFAAAPAAVPVAAAADVANHPGTVTSPMVGVAYLTPDPSSAPFVTEGQSVAAGQTIMLIEAMKTFNQIKAPRAGKVVRILIASGDPVEYGEPLAIIE